MVFYFSFFFTLFYFYCAHCISETGKAGQPAERIISQREGPRPSPCDDGSHVSGEPGGEFSELFTASAHRSAQADSEPGGCQGHMGGSAGQAPSGGPQGDAGLWAPGGEHSCAQGQWLHPFPPAPGLVLILSFLSLCIPIKVLFLSLSVS